MQRFHGLFGALTAILVAGFLICDVAISAEPAGILRAGVAKTDITPTKPVMLAGYGSRKDLSQGVHDPLSARVVAFEQDGKRLVLVSTDLLGFYGGTAESVRKAILDACRLQPSELFLAAIHTHAAPVVTLQSEKVHANNVEYLKTLETQLVAVVREALAHTTARADRGRVRFVARGREPSRSRARRRWDAEGRAGTESVGADGPGSAGPPRFPRRHRRRGGRGLRLCHAQHLDGPGELPRQRRRSRPGRAVSGKASRWQRWWPRPSPAPRATSTRGSACCRSSTRKTAGFRSRS